MALKQLMIQKKIDQRKSLLEELLKKEDDFAKRSDDLEAAINEAESEEEVSTVEEQITNLETEKNEFDEKKSTLEGEISELEGELEQLNSKEPSNKENKDQRGAKHMGKEKRVNSHEYFTREVEDFYSELRTRLEARANGQVLPPGEQGAELVIPETIVNRIRERIGDFTTLYPLVDRITAGGRVKLILDVDAGEASWLEQRGALPETDDSELTAVEFDGFKVGRVVYIDNALLQDSIINLDDYLTNRIARSIAKAVDKGIAVGEGSDSKQPEGIIPAIPAENKVTAAPTYEEIIPHLGKIDTGEDASGEIVAVMHRQTYYAKLATLTLHVNASGNDVVQLPNLAQPNFLGLRVVFNNYVPQDTIVFGVFDKYTLVERESTRIDMSGHYKFREDQTAVRGVGRYDGKPVMPEAFVEVTLEDPEPAV